MNSRDQMLPSKPKNENNTEEPKKKKSFVRISASTREKAAKRVRKKYEDGEVIDAEIIDSEDDHRGSDPHEHVRTGEVLDSEDEDGRRENYAVPAHSKTGDVLGFEEPDYDLDAYDESKIVEEKGLVVTSALQRYLSELRRYPLMKIEEERIVARSAYEENDSNSRNRLVTANLRLVVKIAMEYRRAYSQILDLIQEGNAGLVQAVNRFNPYRGVKLSTYAAWWIRAYILKFLMDNKSLVRMGTTEAQRKLFFRLRSEAEKMYALTQRFDANLLAESIGVKESDVIEMQQRLTKNDVSLDAPVGEDGEARQIDSLVAHTEEPDVKIDREQLLALLNKEVKGLEKELNERDLFIFQERILAEDPITLQDVGNKFGITRERARQLEARVLKKIKERLIAAGIEQ